MNIGSIGAGTDPSTQMGVGMMKSALETQASAVNQLMSGAQQNGSGSQMQSAALAEQGKGQKLNISC